MNPDHHEVRKLRLALRGIWPHPGTMDSFLFLVTEIGELGDALLRLGYGEKGKEYVRNTQKEPDLMGELADVYLMLLTLANHFQVDLSVLLHARIRKILKKHLVEMEWSLKE